MAKFEVNIPEMQAAANKFAAQSENFRSTSSGMLQSAQNLASVGWKDEAGAAFAEKVAQMDKWCQEMSAIIDEYVTKVNEATQRYIEADAEGASFFKYN